MQRQGLEAAFNYSAPNFNPSSTSSAAATGGAFTNAKLNDAFFSKVTYRGACAVGDTWWKAWTKF
jgi:hypothetical protein